MKVSRIATAVVLGSGLLLFLDLFLDWRQTTVNLPVLNVEAGTSGWSGWGIAAGIAVVALVVWEGARLQAEQTPTQLLVAAVLGVLVAAFTIAAFVGGTTVAVGDVEVSVAGHHWPAWAGLVLGVTVAAATLTRLLAAVALHSPRAHAGPV